MPKFRLLSISLSSSRGSSVRSSALSPPQSPWTAPARTRPRWLHEPLPRMMATQAPITKKATSAEENLRRTPFYELNVDAGAKMVPFGGYSMPLQYAQSIRDSHHFTRTECSLFDVSHMVQRIFDGDHGAEFLEMVTPASVADMDLWTSKLSAFLWPDTGGIVDDTIITRTAKRTWHVVTNAATSGKVAEFLKSQAQVYFDTKNDGLLKSTNPQPIWRDLDVGGLFALQGPGSQEVLQKILPADVDLSQLYFGHTIRTYFKIFDRTGNHAIQVSRGGYTGEDGFEISFPNPHMARPVYEYLLLACGPEKLQLAGLGARDSLRTEAGMCLYGHDLDDTTTPVEAGLSWIISPERREKGGFNGAEAILKQLMPKSKGGLGVERRRVGFIVDGAPAREGAEIHSKEGGKIGNVTSGCPSPTLGKNIAMGYIKDGYHKAGTEVDILVRGKPRSAVVTKMPFVPSKYHKTGNKGGA
jgi:aminomethyltransferase